MTDFLSSNPYLRAGESVSGALVFLEYADYRQPFKLLLIVKDSQGHEYPCYDAKI